MIRRFGEEKTKDTSLSSTKTLTEASVTKVTSEEKKVVALNFNAIAYNLNCSRVPGFQSFRVPMFQRKPIHISYINIIIRAL